MDILSYLINSIPPLGEERLVLPSDNLDLSKPLDQYTVSSEYGYRWGGIHEGIDLATSTGTPVFSSERGEVKESSYLPGYGLTVVVKHSDTLDTLYAHLSRTYVQVGTIVSKGTAVGDVGCTGRCTGPHLHFELRKDGEAINPREDINF